jgi:hypothetical protein
VHNHGNAIKNIFHGIYKKFSAVKNSLKPTRQYSKSIKRFFLDNNLREKYHLKKQTDNLVLSFTSFPARIRFAEFTLFSIIRQSVRPEKIILWLSEQEFPETEKAIQDSLKKYFILDFEIRFVKGNIRSYNKLVHALEEFPDHVIVTFDDDVYYKPDWLELLYKTHLEHPRDIIAHRAHTVSFKNGHPESYQNWLPAKDTASYLNFPTAVGGNLYPPRSLFGDACNQDLFLRLSPAADDIWFYVMAVLQKTQIRKVKNGYDRAFDFDYILDDEYKSIPKLADTNIKNNQNDAQLKNVLQYYNLYDSFYAYTEQREQCR